MAAFAVAASRSAASARASAAASDVETRGQLGGGFVQPLLDAVAFALGTRQVRGGVFRGILQAQRACLGLRHQNGRLRARGARGRRLFARGGELLVGAFFLRGDARQISVQEVCFFRLPRLLRFVFFRRRAHRLELHVRAHQFALHRP